MDQSVGVPSEGGTVSGSDEAIVEARTEDEGTLSGGTESSSGVISSATADSVFRAAVLAFAAGSLGRGKGVFGTVFVLGENGLLVAYVLDESLQRLRVPQSRRAARRLAILEEEMSVGREAEAASSAAAAGPHSCDTRTNALCHATARPKLGAYAVFYVD